MLNNHFILFGLLEGGNAKDQIKLALVIERGRRLGRQHLTLSLLGSRPPGASWQLYNEIHTLAWCSMLFLL